MPLDGTLTEPVQFADRLTSGPTEGEETQGSGVHVGAVPLQLPAVHMNVAVPPLYAMSQDAPHVPLEATLIAPVHGAASTTPAPTAGALVQGSGVQMGSLPLQVSAVQVKLVLVPEYPVPHAATHVPVDGTLTVPVQGAASTVGGVIDGAVVQGFGAQVGSLPLQLPAVHVRVVGVPE